MRRFIFPLGLALLCAAGASQASDGLFNRLKRPVPTKAIPTPPPPAATAAPAEIVPVSGHHPAPPACEPGYTYVQEVIHKEVCRKVCKVVPDVKKTTKWVYSCKTEDFCLPKCRLCGGKGCDKGCGECGSCEPCKQCDGPYSKTLLIKRLVTEECPTTKCVVEEIKEVVPCIIWKKVPCGSAAPCVPGASGIAPPGGEPIGPGKKVIMPPASGAAPVPAMPTAAASGLTAPVPAALAAQVPAHLTAPAAEPLAASPAEPALPGGVPALPVARPVVIDPAP